MEENEMRGKRNLFYPYLFRIFISKWQRYLTFSIDEQITSLTLKVIDSQLDLMLHVVE